MINAASWSGETTSVVADDRTSAIRRSLVLGIIVLVATVSISTSLYLYGKQTLQQDAKQVELRGGLGASETNFEMLRRVERLALSVTSIAIVGGVGCLIPLFFASINWRRRVHSQLQQKTEELQTKATGLQNQLADLRRVKDGLLVSQADLEAKLTQLTTDKERLQEELDKRNHAEKALTQKRQELESSKSVLELHVQARTQELHTLQRRYEMILNSAGEGICGLDIEGKATFVNPAVSKLTGWPIAELIGKTEAEIFVRNGETSHSGGTPQHPDEQFLSRKDGTYFPVEFVKTSINENGRVVGSVVVFKDITERKRVEETLARKASELARSNAELEQFAFVASHDLQEPLRKIQAFGDRLKVKCESFESTEIKDYLDRMQNAAARMRNLINDLLAFSRVIRSSEPFVQVDLGVVTKEVLGDLEVRVEKSGAKLEVEHLPTIDADPMQMRQLMLNLISNALKFQPPGGTPVVKVSARTLTSVSGEKLCELTVQDNGIGFDEKYLDKIFAVFQRLHGRSEYEGTGVGLAVCRRIVDRHHGSILAHSQPGKGATFIVTLPTSQQRPEAAK
jgi:PAS domain S-box-containing protein